MDSKEKNVFVNLKDLPRFSTLNARVQNILWESSAYEVWGHDLMIIFGSFILFALGLWLISAPVFTLSFASGIFLLGCFHSITTSKGSHLAAHHSLSSSPVFNEFLKVFLSEFWGSYSAKMGTEIHIKIHHPYTNIIGLGDSSSWKVPFLPSMVYMFFAPVIMPTITPFVAVGQLWGRWKDLAAMLAIVLPGLWFNAALLVYWSGFTYPTALLCMCVYRAVFSIPYIHINIFQHIGLPMYCQDPEHKVKRVYQMSSGVLNLSRNLLLDVVFGHSLISCHVEHHLFPNLSDNMCLKIKPIVSKFIKESNLVYNEAEYSERFWYFVKRYDELMVNAPPITHFVGIQ